MPLGHCCPEPGLCIAPWPALLEPCVALGSGHWLALSNLAPGQVLGPLCALHFPPRGLGNLLQGPTQSSGSQGWVGCSGLCCSPLSSPTEKRAFGLCVSAALPPRQRPHQPSTSSSLGDPWEAGARAREARVSFSEGHSMVPQSSGGFSSHWSG